MNYSGMLWYLHWRDFSWKFVIILVELMERYDNMRENENKSEEE